MSEKPKEDSQTFSEFISLANKIEEIVGKTPDLNVEDKIEEIKEEGEKGEEEEKEEVEEKPIRESEKEIEDVEKQTSVLEKQIGVVQKETTQKPQEKRLKDIMELENALSKLFENARVAVEDFYYASKEIEHDDIIKQIQTRLHSLEMIKISDIETMSFPFALCKLENNYKAVLPLDLDGILLPTYREGDSKELKMLAVGQKEFKEIEAKERENLIQAINKIQMKLVKLLNRDSKDRLLKDVSLKHEIVKINEKIIHEYINEYERKMNSTHTYQKELIQFLNHLKKNIENDKQIWEESKIDRAIRDIKPQLINKREEYTARGRESQVNFIKLKRTQKQIDARTKKLQIDEKRGKKVTREEKEELIRQLRKFQESKKEIQETINETKKHEDVLEKWIEIFSAEEIGEVNERILSYFGKRIVKILEEAIQNQEIGTILDETAKINAVLEAITIHVVYVPIYILTFNAKQANQKIEGKIFYFEPTREIHFLKPSIS